MHNTEPVLVISILWHIFNDHNSGFETTAFILEFFIQIIIYNQLNKKNYLTVTQVN